jgi:hypothetical protein
LLPILRALVAVLRVCVADPPVLTVLVGVLRVSVAVAPFIGALLAPCMLGLRAAGFCVHLRDLWRHHGVPSRPTTHRHTRTHTACGHLNPVSPTFIPLHSSSAQCCPPRNPDWYAVDTKHRCEGMPGLGRHVR